MAEGELNNLRYIVVIILHAITTGLSYPLSEGVKQYSKHIIVVNDGSTDTTSEYWKSIPGIQIITQK